MNKETGARPFVGEGERRQLWAFVDGETPPGERDASRVALILDCVDAATFRGQPSALEDDERDLAIVRILSTPARLERLFRLPRTPKEGDWLVIELAHKSNRPMAWVLTAENEYRGPAQRTRLVGMRFVPDEAAMSDHRRQGGQPEDALEALSWFMTSEQLTQLHAPPSSASSASGEAQLETYFGLVDLGLPASAFHPRAIDVGQASAIALHERRDPKSDIVGYFDVGAPLWFHNSSMPQKCDFRVPKLNGFVILSHWDFDHFAMALWHQPQLQQFEWFAPRQAVGRNTRRFQERLDSRLNFIELDDFGSQTTRLVRGSGPPADRNASGYVMWLQMAGGPRLLTGDVGYEHIPANRKLRLKGLTVPHHGGASAALPPRPRKDGIAVASYGKPNKYRHPDEVFLTTHSDRDWRVQRTAKHRKEARGSRWL